MLPAGHSHLPAATMGSAAAAASTRMACEGSLQWLARFVRYGGRHAVHGTMWYHGTYMLGTITVVKSSNKLSQGHCRACASRVVKGGGY